MFLVNISGITGYMDLPLPSGFPGGTGGKEPACQCRRHKRRGFDLGSGRSPGGGHGNPLQYSCWQIPQTEKPGGLQSKGSQRVRHNGSESARKLSGTTAGADDAQANGQHRSNKTLLTKSGGWPKDQFAKLYLRR